MNQSANVTGRWVERRGVGVAFVHIVRSLYSERGDRFFMLPGQNIEANLMAWSKISECDSQRVEGGLKNGFGLATVATRTFGSRASP